MVGLVAALVHWVVRHAVLLILITCILIAGKWSLAQLRSAERALAQHRTDLVHAQASQSALMDEPGRTLARVEQLLPAKPIAAETAESMLDRVKAERRKLEADKASLEAGHPISSRIPSSSPIYIKVVRLEFEISALQAAEAHLGGVVFLVRSLGSLQLTQEKCELALRDVTNAENANLMRRRSLSANNPVLRNVPGTNAIREIERLDAERRSLVGHRDEMNRQLRLLRQFQDAQRSAIQILEASRARRTAQLRDVVQSKRDKVEEHIATLASAIDENHWRRLREEVMSTFWQAASVLFLAILSRPTVKVIFFFVIGPWVAKVLPMRLLVGASGAVVAKLSGSLSDGVAGKVSKSSLSMVLRPGQELLVHADYLQSKSPNTPVTTVLCLDPKRPLTCLAADMVLLQRILPDGLRPVTLSSTKQDLLEVALIELPDLSAFVLRPRALVGVVQSAERPILITSHWRLTSLHSWMSLQFRYLVFHGPGQLLVKGSRGVILESASGGRVINQSRVLGYSAGLERSSARGDTFVSYLRGEQDLFNERFQGDEGWVVYEEIPSLGSSRSMFFGRGFEGVTDAFLKIFGV